MIYGDSKRLLIPKRKFKIFALIFSVGVFFLMHALVQMSVSLHSLMSSGPLVFVVYGMVVAWRARLKILTGKRGARDQALRREFH